MGEDKTVSATLGDISVYPRERNFLIQQAASLGGGAVSVRPQEASPLAEALVRWVNAGRPQARKGSQTVLYVGGPLHGKIDEIPATDQYRYTMTGPSFNSEFFTSGPPEIPERKITVYTRMGELPDDLPFAVFEHEDVAKQNVHRRAEQLDKKLAELYEREQEAERRHDTLYMQENSFKGHSARLMREVEKRKDELRKYEDKQEQAAANYSRTFNARALASEELITIERELREAAEERAKLTEETGI